MKTQRIRATLLTGALIALPSLLAAQDVIFGKFYRYQVIGSGSLPPVNDGVVSFAW
jgi:hypothetical protein